MPGTVVVADIGSAVQNVPVRSGHRARLVAISGIDSSGKGHTAARLAENLSAQGAHVALIGIDAWLNLPPVRFASVDPGRHFYQSAFRFEPMFSDLVDPLTRDGSIDLLMDLTEETAHEYRKHRYAFENVDTVLLEGIFLLRRDLRFRYDLKIWVECSFESALRRAILRAQEGLSPEETAKAFQTIYFPAQSAHFGLDDPKSSADLIFDNEIDFEPLGHSSR